ncbi:ATP-binding protein [Sutcliffiella rhizosphaerae]|uniref:histidine kinase n=1 Tax=Sutcliffiella rhizosphaerae TaxID=2880967 RepID=A0ABM8YRZ3_9BACI|nr:sensor histidine kinase [Sutcliffiella rhizosphaerae]CAG9622767.1 Sensor protein CitS [Sutcliffiella rhizosphaerae]
MKARWPLERKFMFLVCILISMIMCMVTGVYIYFEQKQARELVGQQALTTAIAVSEIPEVRRILATNESAAELQPFIERIREQSGAEFIVIGDREEIRYTHPQPEKIGQTMVGGDNEDALIHGKSYVSLAEGSLGSSVRGKTPIFDENGEIVGVVSVGFMITYVDSYFMQGLIGVLMWLSFIFIIGVFGSFMLAKSIRKDTFGLEPHQIGRMYKERGAILESINEGLIATDQDGNVTLVNQSAKEILGIGLDGLGKPIKEILPQSEIAHVLSSKQVTGSYETIFKKKHLIVNYETIDDGGSYAGKVASFKDRSGLQELINTLSEVQQYSQGLRAQTHEYTNKLYAISGWIQLGHTEKAKQFIHEEIGQQRSFENLLFEQISDPTIQAVLIGKLSKASEKKISFSINEESVINFEWPKTATAPLVTVIGNVIDNAFDAVLGKPNPEVDIFLTDVADDLIIEVADNGSGISPTDLEQIYEQGFTTKEGKQRGFGLALVQAALVELGGSIEITENQSSGTVVNLYIPKIRRVIT